MTAFLGFLVDHKKRLACGAHGRIAAGTARGRAPLHAVPRQSPARLTPACAYLLLLSSCSPARTRVGTPSSHRHAPGQCSRTHTRARTPRTHACMGSMTSCGTAPPALMRRARSTTRELHCQGGVLMHASHLVLRVGDRRAFYCNLQAALVRRAGGRRANLHLWVAAAREQSKRMPCWRSALA